MSDQDKLTREWLFIIFSNIGIKEYQTKQAGGRCKISEGHNS